MNTPLLIAAIAVFGVLLHRTILQWFGLRWSWRFLSSSGGSTPASRREFSIVLPMFQEQSICRDTLRYFADLWGADERVRQIVVVTTARERRLCEEALVDAEEIASDLHRLDERDLIVRYGNSLSIAEIQQLMGVSAHELPSEVRRVFSTRPSTFDIAFDECRQLNERLGRELFVALNSPSTNGNRATQVNYCIQSLRARGALSDTLFVGIFDADSRPARATLDEIASLPDDHLALQQPTLYLAGLERFESGSAIMWADALIQTFWCLSYETPNWHRAAETVHATGWRALFRRPTYATGHGEWLRGDLLERIEGVPEDVRADGMFLGYLLTGMGVPLRPLRSIDVVEVPLYPGQVIRQHKMWFAGALDVLRLLRPGLRTAVCETPFFTRLLIVLKETWINVRWAFGPPTVALAFLAWIAAGGSAAMSAVFAAIVVAHSIAPAIFLWLAWPRLERFAGMSLTRPRRSMLVLAGGAAGRAIVRCVGPCLCLAGYVGEFLFGRAMTFQKTAR